MYFVDHKKLARTLDYFKTLLDSYEKAQFETKIEKLALERICHMMIESFLDISNMMIDGFVMRDPGSFQDIVEIMADEKVIPEDEKQAYMELISLRNVLIKEYTELDHALIKEKIDKHLDIYKRYHSRIHMYLKEESVVANTFTNEDLN